MKHEGMINAETAEKFKNLLVPEADRLRVRPVLWSEDSANEAFDAYCNGESGCMEYCQRDLIHFVHQGERVRALIVRVRIASSLYLMSLDDLVLSGRHPGTASGWTVTRMLLGDEKSIRQTVNLSGLPMKEFIQNINVYRLGQYSEMKDEDRQALGVARVLEYYAFSKYAVTKPRPTFKQATNPNPKKKGWAAIEVVRLRLPERQKKDASPGTGKKLDMRIQVTEHLRRQPTKQGIKLITIAEHWRGPESAPVKPKTQKVYKVVK